MGTVIHAKKGKDDTFSYRAYSTVTDCYLTPPLNEEEISLFLLYESCINGGLNRLLVPQSLVQGLEEARKKGTSSCTSEKKMTSWERKPQEYWGRKFAKEKTKKSLLEDITDFLSAPLYEHIRTNINSSFAAQGRNVWGKKTPEAKREKIKIQGLMKLLPDK